MDMTNKIYQENQKITFKDLRNGGVHTRLIKWVVVNPFNGEVSYYVNPVGCGTQCQAVYHCNVISVK